jgi:hypothetical protein
MAAVSMGLEAVALLVVVGLFGSELAIAAFVHPALTRLDDATHARAGARTLGAAMPFWYALALILTLLEAWLVQAPGSTARGLAFCAAGLLAASVAFSLLGPVRINNRVIGWRLDALPADWREQRRRWDRMHEVRVGVLAAAALLLSLASAIGD